MGLLADWAFSATARLVSCLGDWGESLALARARLDSRVIATTSGPVEYAATGEGPAVLVIHGCPGGYDQGLIAARLANSEDFTFISPSRPGYLRTPLYVGVTPEAQADAYVSLLDSLGISKVAIVGISGGGPSALQFAIRHPERCWGLVTVCAIARRLSGREIAKCRSVLRRLRCTADLALQLVRTGARLLAKESGFLAARGQSEREYCGYQERAFRHLGLHHCSRKAVRRPEPCRRRVLGALADFRSRQISLQRG